MSQRNRIVFTAIALAAVLLMAAPAPSRAAALWEGRIPGAGALERVWDWMAGFRLSGSPRRPAAWGEKEGSAINPDGRPTPGPAAPTTPPASLEDGGAVNPDGVR